MSTITKTPGEVLKSIIKKVDEGKVKASEKYKPISFYFKMIDDNDQINIHEINPEFYSELFIKIIDKDSEESDYYTSIVARYIVNNSPTNLSNDLAIKFISKKYYAVVCRNLNCFKQLSFDVAKELIETKDYCTASSVSRDIQKFYKSQHKRIALCLIENGFEDILKRDLQSFDREVLER